jgi:pimeloyl-ACP methyl ester carboxylesterase
MALFVIAHGAWSGGWAWRRLRSMLRERGHECLTPTYTGLGERAHLAAPTVGLDTHVQDVVGVLEFEDLRDVVLVGHSYGGMVITGVADRAPERLARLIYLDAFVPRDGESLFSLQPAEGRAIMQARVTSEGDGWLITPNPLPADTSAEDRAWLTPRRRPQPVQTFDQPLRLQQGETLLPRAYIYCKQAGPGDVFGQFAARARHEGWPYRELDATHNAHITASEALTDLLVELAS